MQTSSFIKKNASQVALFHSNVSSSEYRTVADTVKKTFAASGISVK